MEDVKQYIILRKDAKTISGQPVSFSKMAVMVAHASMAFLSNKIRKNTKNNKTFFQLTTEENFWLQGIFTKILLSAKNLNELNKIIQTANKFGFKEDIDYFLIKDNCLTELLPDKNEKTCFIAIGFRPMNIKDIKPIIKKLQLYK
mgnify:CR=1 FL=1